MKIIIAITAIVSLLIGTGLTLAITKAVRPVIPACPACNCPPSAEVDLGVMNMDQLKKIKGNFTNTQTFSNVTVKINCEDSVLLMKLIHK